MRRFTLATLLATFTAITPGAFGQCQYEVTAVIQAPECPFTGPPPLTGRSINNAGHVVGWYFKCDFSGDIPFLWTPKNGLQELDLPVDNVTSARAMDINNNGAICGRFLASDDDMGFRAFVITAEGEFIEIAPPEGSNQLEAMALNDAGQVVGWWTQATTGAMPFLWQDGKFETLPGTQKFYSITAVDINESGQITGKVRVNDGDEELAYVWDNGKTTILPPVPPNGIDSNPRALNATGRVTGRGNIPLRDNPQLSYSHAYAADVEGAQNLGQLPGFEESTAWSIHDNGLIVGQSFTTSNFGPGTIWHHGAIFDVNDLLINKNGFFVKGFRDTRSDGALLAFANDENNDTVAAILEPVDPALADITGDCEVNVFDLIALLDNWAKTDSFADIDDNGVVSVVDLLILLSNWGS